MRRAILVPVVAALCFALGACGSGGGSSTDGSGTSASTTSTTSAPLSAKAYTGFLVRLNKQETQIQATAQKGLGSKSLPELGDALSTYADQQESVGERISGITPPANAQAANQALAKGFTDSAAAVRALLPQVSDADSVAAAQSLLVNDKDALQAGNELDAALAQLKKLGYTKGG